jgi:outer membrane protein TolC
MMAAATPLVRGAGPVISLPLFDSKRLKSEFNTATALQDEAMSAYNDTVLQAVQQVAEPCAICIR